MPVGQLVPGQHPTAERPGPSPRARGAVRVLRRLLKKRLGEDSAKQMAEAHEEAFPGSDADKADAANNILGLELADQVKTDKECRERVHEMWEAGLLATRHDYE